MAIAESRYIVGIDLGTTHTVVAFVDTASGSGQIEIFEIEQLVAPGEIKARPLFPSLRYHPAVGELPENQLLLPWHQAANGIDCPPVFGELARALSSKVEGRTVVSAKSWLSHEKVDRAAEILPWGAGEGVQKVSPIDASASYLMYIRDAWNHLHPEHPLQDQDIVLTVPASFDEAARALTITASRRAQLSNVRLLEEPQAVCYHWLFRNKDDLDSRLAGSKLMLVCDVGGGTTDLTLIKITYEEGRPPSLTRIGVGDHLMLGGDNIDLALAHMAEKKLSTGEKKLSAASLAQLLEQCRIAKEKLLSGGGLEKANVTVLGAGSRLMGGAKTTEFCVEEVQQLALNGFFPKVALSDKPKVKRSALVEFGLPYAADAAISRHVANFLSHYSRACAEALCLDEGEMAVPDCLLLNGGMFNSEMLTERIVEQLADWRGADVNLLENDQPDLAVAYGAVASGLAQRGEQARIGGGSARSYFLVLDKDKNEGVCILPQASEENHQVRLAEHRFLLSVGAPVQFEMASSTIDKSFEPGQLVTLNKEDFPILPPLATVMKKRGKMKGSEVEVQIAATLTDVGTLEVQNISTEDSNRRWTLAFDLRRDESISVNHSAHPKLEQARSLIEAVYGGRTKNIDAKAVKKLRNELERLLGGRDQWEPSLLRDLFGPLLVGVKKRRRSADHERVWCNLAGFTLRPGFGFPVDEWRIEKIQTLYKDGLQYRNESVVWADWWNFWRRVSGGLNTEAQEMIFDDIAPYLQPLPEKPKAHLAQLKRKGYLAFDDLLRLAASLENLPKGRKVIMGGWLLKRLEKPSESTQLWWALGRLGARVPMYGSSHNVVPVAEAEQWLAKILTLDWKKVSQAPLAATTLSRKSGDRSHDISLSLRREVVERLVAHRATQSWIDMVEQVVELDAADEKRIWGDALPPGIRLVKED
ncbi:MAG: hsp70 family protein [Gammaproteobacteria bacterium]|nr:hsp70 family protein [Gammaproteobacteria bacterium]